MKDDKRPISRSLVVLLIFAVLSHVESTADTTPCSSESPPHKSHFVGCFRLGLTPSCCCVYSSIVAEFARSAAAENGKVTKLAGIQENFSGLSYFPLNKTLIGVR
jgi:hypothetical protein